MTAKSNCTPVTWRPSLRFPNPSSPKLLQHTYGVVSSDLLNLRIDRSNCL